MRNTRHNSFIEVRDYDNETLRSLIKEIRLISSLDAPAHAKYSPILRKLFNIEKSDYESWFDQFSTIRQAIELTILDRVYNDKW